jgi:membrane complex biogenesis BtpA family protein
MTWLKKIFNVEKPIIAMCHLAALPGDPGYDVEKGLDWVIERARKDLRALQDGGVDAVMFSNEASLPYLTQVEPITYVTMARVIGELRSEIHTAYGVNVLWDPKASIDLAMATGAMFVREIFTGVYASDFGLWNTSCGEVLRHQHAIHAEHVKLLYNIVPEAAVYMGHRDICDIARSTVFNNRPDALCVSGLIAGAEASIDILRQVKEAVPDTPVLANTGVRVDNVQKQLEVADGAVTRLSSGMVIFGMRWMLNACASS